MRRKEFVEKVEGLGFETKVSSVIRIFNTEGNMVAMIDDSRRYSVDTITHSFYKIDEATKEKLYNLLARYAGTPLEEREDKKKYVVKKEKVFYNEYLKIDMFGYYAFLNNYSTETGANFQFNEDIALTFTDIRKAEAMAVLVNGKVEELV